MIAESINHDLFLKAVTALPADGLSSVRQRAAEAFSQSGFPTRRDEDWKYTNLKPAVELCNEWLQLGAPADQAVVDSAISGQVNATWITLLNGNASFDELDLPKGVSIERLSSDTTNTLLNTDDAVSLFNAALLKDALRITVGAGTVLDRPLGLLIADNSDSGNHVTQFRILIEIQEGAQAQVIECHQSNGDGKHFGNGVVEVQLHGSSSLRYVRLQERARHHVQIGKTLVNVGRDARFEHCAFDLGGALVRNDLAVRLSAAGASATLNGLYLVGDGQHIDNHTAVHHEVGPSVCEQEYRGILNRRARGVFNSKAIVYKGADGSDAKQANHNLLLSDDAEIDTKPELEIYADDVKAAHGATVGQLDANALYYLRTRGIDEELATQLLTRAFAATIVAALPVAELQTYASELVERRLDSLTGKE